MTPDFRPRLDILPAAQRRLWGELVAVPKEFVLYGGTAIALHLGHRASVDFDFFSFTPFDPDRLTRSLPFLQERVNTLQKSSNTLTVVVDRNGPVKLSFFAVPELGRVCEAVITADIHLQVADLPDLAGAKASVVQKRAEAKDYLDLDALFQSRRIDLPTALAAGRLVYGSTFNPEITLKALRTCLQIACWVANRRDMRAIMDKWIMVSLDSVVRS
jgi:hypothetical protein